MKIGIGLQSTLKWLITACIYARVSTSDQSTESQLLDLRQYASTRNWDIYQEYCDRGISGTKDSRPALNDLMADARKRKFDVVLVWRFDRFARSTKHLILALEEFRHLGIDFVSYTPTPAVRWEVPSLQPKLSDSGWERCQRCELKY